MIWLVLLGVVGLAVLYFAIKRIRWEKTSAVGDSVNRVFYKHVVEINLKNQDGTSRQEVISRCHKNEELQLVPDPDNPHDPYAVKVCCKNGQQIGYLPTDNGRMAHDLATGWTFRTIADEIYPFEENPQKHGIRLRVEVLTMEQKQKTKEGARQGLSP